MQPEIDVHLDSEPSLPAATTAQTLPLEEQPCFTINQIRLEGEDAHYFNFALEAAIKQSGFKPGMCLGSQGIRLISQMAQNSMITRGFVTSRVILPEEQNLQSGQLILQAQAGRIHEIRYQGGRYLLNNALTIKSGQILNIRNIEQSLENLKRLPTIEADIQMEPARENNQTDLVITVSQRTIPLRLAFSLDDSGSHSTGRYQGGITLSVDNPLGLSDLFYANYNQDLGGKNSETDIDGDKTGSSTNGYTLHYSVPMGNWLWSFNRSHYRYHQAIAGLTENYDYNGNSDNTDFGFNRLLYRDKQRKTSFGFKLWRRESHNFINDAEIEIQARRTGGWQASLDHREYIKNLIVNLNLGYKRGTGAGHSLAAPEEAFNEGTSRMKIMTADLGIFWPFQLGKQNFGLDSSWHGQWNKTPLITQDQLSIGSRYTVSGFDGEVSLMAPRGWYWQNNLAWSYQPQHQVYLGVDIGHIGTNALSPQLGQTLAGAVIGLKGQFQAGGALSYDLFVGKPIYKPQYFRTARTTGGFNLNYAF